MQTYQADLSSLGETRNTQHILSDHSHLDVLINNAGILKTPNPTLNDGQDIRFVVNTLAPYVLTKQILPIIPSGGRILNLSSAAQAPIDITALRGERSLDDMAAYAQSKLAITIWSQVMAAEHPNGPTIIAVNPGSLLATKMVKEGFGIMGHDLNIGADILCHLALDAEYSNASGLYWDNEVGRLHPHTTARRCAACSRRHANHHQTNSCIIVEEHERSTTGLAPHDGTLCPSIRCIWHMFMHRGLCGIPPLSCHGLRPR